jgi:hypothetical protein
MLMTPEQALQILIQTLVTKQGLSVQDCATVAQAWNVVVTAITKPAEPEKDKV